MLGDPFGATVSSNPRGAAAAGVAARQRRSRVALRARSTSTVETLNIDAASFRQMETATAGERRGRSRELVRQTVARAGQAAQPGHRLGRNAARARDLGGSGG